jgi:hypothetical protein
MKVNRSALSFSEINLSILAVHAVDYENKPYINQGLDEGVENEYIMMVHGWRNPCSVIHVGKGRVFNGCPSFSSFSILAFLP